MNNTNLTISTISTISTITTLSTFINNFTNYTNTTETPLNSDNTNTSTNSALSSSYIALIISVVGLFSTIIVKYNIKKVKVCCLDLDCTKPKKNKRVKNSKILEEIDDEKYIEKDRITITNTLESELKPKPKLKPIPILIATKQQPSTPQKQCKKGAHKHPWGPG